MNETNRRTKFLVPRPYVAALLIAVQLAVVSARALNASETTPQVSRDEDVVADFQQRVDRYMELHDSSLQYKGIPPDQRTGVGPNQVSQRALATRIRASRPYARQGEIFAPAIAAMLRMTLNPQLRGAAAAGTRASIRDDAPAKFALQVNGAYPAGASLPTAPPNVLAILPTLPEGLEYRIVDTHLILMDVDAGIVVDYLIDVMCARC